MKTFNELLLDLDEGPPGRPGSAERVRWETSRKGGGRTKKLKNQKRRRNKNKPDEDNDIFRTSINMPRKSSEPTRRLPGS